MMTKERGSQSCGERSRNVRLTCVVPRGSDRKSIRDAEQEPVSLKIHTSTAGRCSIHQSQESSACQYLS